MRIPGFTADTALYQSRKTYGSIATGTDGTGVTPQMRRVVSHYPDPRHPGHLCIGVEDDEAGQSYEICQ